MDNNKFLQDLRNLLNTYKKWIFAILILGVAAYTFVALKPDGYEQLYSNLSASDKTAILTELSKRGVDYKLDSTGTTISVKSGNATWVRQAMDDMGLPTGGDGSTQGLGILSQSSLGTTSKQYQDQELIATKQQLQLELVRSFPFISAATVNLTMPQQTSIFQDNSNSKGTASVILSFKQGTSITQQQLQGIQYMVSSAIPGVSAKEVTVIDSKTGVLSSASVSGGDSSSSSYDKQLQIENTVEKGIHDDIKNSLSSLLGYDNVQLNVKVAINFDQIVQNIEQYGKPVLRSSHDVKEDTSKIDNLNSTQAGIASNGDITGYNATTGTGGTVGYLDKKDDIIQNFEIDKTAETIRKNPSLTNTNIVVWADNKKLQQKNINIKQFRQAIGVAAGLTYNQQTDSFTNGQVVVLSSNFEPLPNAPKTNTIQVTGFASFINQYGLILVIGIAALLLLVGVLIFFLLKKKKKKEIDEKTLQNAIDALNRSQEEQGDSHSIELTIGDDEKEEIETEEEKNIRIKGEKRHKELNEQVVRLSDEYTKESAEYVKRLLKERN